VQTDGSDKRRESDRRYREANRERIKEQNRAYREKNREAAIERSRAWRKANPDYSRRYYQENRERLKERDREHYKKNAERIKERNRRYAATPEAKRRARIRRLAKNYGISYEEYTGMAEAQGWVCGACGGEPNGLGLVVDHDHGDGNVRGLLCSKCNSALGLLDDSLNKVEALAVYMRRGNSITSEDVDP
jgi:Recombination endonuclease VII